MTEQTAVEPTATAMAPREPAPAEPAAPAPAVGQAPAGGRAARPYESHDPAAPDAHAGGSAARGPSVGPTRGCEAAVSGAAADRPSAGGVLAGSRADRRPADAGSGPDDAVALRPLVGLIVPSSNPTIEALLHRIDVAAVLGVDVVCTRLRVLRIGADAGASAQFAAEAMTAAAQLLGDAGVDAVVWAGTSGFWLGADREREVLDAVSRDVGVPVTSSREAVLAGLGDYGAAEVGVFTPYVEQVHDDVVAAVAAAGFPVAASRGLGLSRNLDFARIAPAEVDGGIAALAGPGGGRPVAVICTNVAAARPTPTPVVDSVIATLWWAARTAGGTTAGYAATHTRMVGGTA